MGNTNSEYTYMNENTRTFSNEEILKALENKYCNTDYFLKSIKIAIENNDNYLVEKLYDSFTYSSIINDFIKFFIDTENLTYLKKISSHFGNKIFNYKVFEYALQENKQHIIDYLFTLNINLEELVIDAYNNDNKKFAKKIIQDFQETICLYEIINKVIENKQNFELFEYILDNFNEFDSIIILYRAIDSGNSKIFKKTLDLYDPSFEFENENLNGENLNNEFCQLVVYLIKYGHGTIETLNEMLNDLLNEYPNINFRRSDALEYASEYGYYEIVKRLLQNKHITESSIRDAIHLANLYKHEKIINLLLDDERVNWNNYYEKGNCKAYKNEFKELVTKRRKELNTNR